MRSNTKSDGSRRQAFQTFFGYYFMILKKVVTCVWGSITNHHQKAKPTNFRKKAFVQHHPTEVHFNFPFDLKANIKQAQHYCLLPPFPINFKKLYILSCVEGPFEFRTSFMRLIRPSTWSSNTTLLLYLWRQISFTYEKIGTLYVEPRFHEKI